MNQNKEKYLYMKKLILSFIMSVLCLSISAQENLNITPLFENLTKYDNDATCIWVDGNELRKYKLTLYRSVATKNNQAISHIEKAVIADSKKAADKEMGFIGSRLYFAFLSLPSETVGQNFRRFIFYRNKGLKNGSNKEATLVYMEGKVTMREIKKLFK